MSDGYDPWNGGLNRQLGNGGLNRRLGNGGLNRREFLAAGAAAGAMAAGLPGVARAETPKRGGIMRYASTVDGNGLDPHRNLIFYVSNPLAPTTQGLLDLDQKMEIVPGIAEEWEISKDLKTYTFRLRKGVEYHNGADVDAASVKWNYERILDPKIGYAFTRASLLEIESMEADGKHLLHIHLKKPSAVFAANVVYYPCCLIAPNSVDQADTNPMGCGPFKFKSWKRYAKTEMVRFENYFETGFDGKPLPYLDGLEVYPKREDKVRLTALRTGEVDMTQSMSFFDVNDFEREYGDRFTIWNLAQGGTAHLNLNAKAGPFAMNAPDGKLLRQAVAHAIDKQAIHEAVYNGFSEPLKQFYASTSSWYNDEVPNELEYDPEKSRFILRKLNMQNLPIAVVARDTYQYMRNGAEIVHAMLLDAGFGATNEVFDNPVLREKYKKNDWGIDSTGSSFRFEPDGWFSRWIHSEGAEGKLRSGFKSERADKLIEEARVTLDQGKRKEIYREVDGIVNDEAALIYAHAIPVTSAAAKKVRGYEPAIAGPPSWSGGGVRTAYLQE
ncbi:MAG: ABC transporter substrate-binding protein [Alphaproteobacteria bacterium]|nr:ABC transporter substrate-binding protein [Alphaproteobacteria bacterium]MCB9931670.1 ABC transporter substrate-binding protein [Alphaproteobacteria bacterium]